MSSKLRDAFLCLSVGTITLLDPVTVRAAANSNTNEALACRAWVERTFSSARGEAGFLQSSPCIEVVYEDARDSISRGRSWRGTPFHLGERTFSHGLAFNSTKHLKVQLGRPGRQFSAFIGLENNDDTQRGEAMGQGSVTFHVLVRGTEVFKSPVLRRKDGATKLTLNLQGATEFEIQVKDGGDGRGWDQALWAEAMVTLEDGTELRLQDLPPRSSASYNPFGLSFLYGGTNSAALLTNWSRTASIRDGGSAATSRELLYRELPSGLEVRIEALEFADFPAVEWVAFFSNRGSRDTRMLESIQALDAVLPVTSSGPAVLHWAKGAVASFDDFAPQETVLKPGTKFRLQPGGGRSSSGVMPFFNLQGATGGIISAIGWSGEWLAQFESDDRGEVTMKAGLEKTHLVLHPGETVRTPRMLLLFYEGDRWRGQNLLRQFLLKHHRPSMNGQPLVPPITCGNWGGTRAEVHLDNIAKIIKQDLPIDYYWIDAEWFGKGGWPVNVGSWEVKKDLYPAGFKPLSDALQPSGRKLMLWFEPERVYKDTTWYKEHKEWLLDVGGSSLLLDLGNEAARRFLTDFISSKIKEFGLRCYRQDFNIEPLPFWRKADAPDRQGIAEIRYIEGLYAFWDELLARHPGLIIDNCASGGRRIDLETVGRATPFWRTDGPRDAIAHQCHTYGLLSWVPLSATSQDRAQDDYEFRSSMCSSLCLNWWVSGDVPAERIPENFPFTWAKATLDQYVKYRDYYYGDYYPLTGYSQARDLWMAYQLDRPDLGSGLVVVLRRPESPYESARFPLRGLDRGKSYILTNLDTKAEATIQAAQLLDEGLPVPIGSRPGSALYTYRAR